MRLGQARVLRADARHLPLPDDSVDLVVSSPPYWSLRAYQDNGEAYDGQIGAESTPQEFVDSLIEVTRELVRVTKPSGSIWINLGDKYAQRDGQGNNGHRGGGIAASESDYHVTSLDHGGRPADYCRLAEWRCNDRDQLAKVLGVAKVDPVHPDETSLLDLLDGGAA